MSNDQELRERVMTMLEENLEDPSGLANIGPDDDLSVLGVTSVTFIKLVIATEMEFGVSWDDEDLDYRHFLTINSIINYIANSKPISAE